MSWSGDHPKTRFKTVTANCAAAKKAVIPKATCEVIASISSDAGLGICDGSVLVSTQTARLAKHQGQNRIQRRLGAVMGRPAFRSDENQQAQRAEGRKPFPLGADESQKTEEAKETNRVIPTHSSPHLIRVVHW
jgi:hypothetical protein